MITKARRMLPLPLLLANRDTGEYYRTIERKKLLPGGWMRKYRLERTCELISFFVEDQGLSRNRNGCLRRKGQIKTWRNQSKRGLKARRKRAGWDRQYLLQVLRG